MTPGRIAIVVAESARDAAEWREANQGWLGADGTACFIAAEGGPLLAIDGGEPTSAPAGAKEGFLLTRSDWRVDRDFGAIACDGGFAAATGRLMSRSPARGVEGASVYNDIAPYLVAGVVEQFSISATLDGMLCARLPFECLWIGSRVASDVLGLLSDGRPAEAALETLFADRRLAGGVGYAYLSDMKALWRRDSDIKTCASYGRRL